MDVMFQASVGFLEKTDEGSFEKAHTIYFTRTVEEGQTPQLVRQMAMADAVRWARNRQRAMPDYFGPLLFVKVYEFQPEPIAKNGQYELPHRGFGSEWKCDCGRPAPGEA